MTKPVAGQGGLILTRILPWAVALGVLAWIGVRIVPLYFEYWGIQQVFAEKARQGNLFDTPRALEREVLEELEFQDLHRLDARSVEVERLPGKGRYRIGARYEVAIPVSERIRLVITFEPEARGNG